MMFYRPKRAVTLVELVIAILLLSTVVFTAVTLELAVRRMQIRPADEVKLLDELLPAVNTIRKDFERQIGSFNNLSLSIEEGGQRLVIRVDADNSGNISAGDQWHAYRWNGTVGSPLEYAQNNATFNETLAQGITAFSISSVYNDRAINMVIRTRKNPGLAEDPSTNPAVNLTTTLFSRMATAR